MKSSLIVVNNLTFQQMPEDPLILTVFEFPNYYSAFLDLFDVKYNVSMY